MCVKHEPKYPTMYLLLIGCPSIKQSKTFLTAVCCPIRRNNSLIHNQKGFVKNITISNAYQLLYNEQNIYSLWIFILLIQVGCHLSLKSCQQHPKRMHKLSPSTLLIIYWVKHCLYKKQ